MICYINIAAWRLEAWLLGHLAVSTWLPRCEAVPQAAAWQPVLVPGFLPRGASSWLPGASHTGPRLRSWSAATRLWRRRLLLILLASGSVSCVSCSCMRACNYGRCHTCHAHALFFYILRPELLSGDGIHMEDWGLSPRLVHRFL